MGNNLAISQKLNINLQHDPEIPLPCMCPREVGAYIPSNICGVIFTATVFKVEATQKPIRQGMDELHVGLSIVEYLVSKGTPTNSCCSMDEPQIHSK